MGRKHRGFAFSTPLVPALFTSSSGCSELCPLWNCSYKYCTLLSSVSHSRKLWSKKESWEPPQCAPDRRMHDSMMSTQPASWPKGNVPSAELGGGRTMRCLDLGLQQLPAWLTEDGPKGKTQSFLEKAPPQDFLLAREWLTAQGLGHFTDVCSAAWSRKPWDAVRKPAKETPRLSGTSRDKILPIHVLIRFHPGRELTGREFTMCVQWTGSYSVWENRNWKDLFRKLCGSL